jgi:hypothetical protein
MPHAPRIEDKKRIPSFENLRMKLANLRGAGEAIKQAMV